MAWQTLRQPFTCAQSKQSQKFRTASERNNDLQRGVSTYLWRSWGKWARLRRGWWARSPRCWRRPPSDTWRWPGCRCWAALGSAAGSTWGGRGPRSAKTAFYNPGGSWVPTPPWRGACWVASCRSHDHPLKPRFKVSFFICRCILLICSRSSNYLRLDILFPRWTMVQPSSATSRMGWMRSLFL